MNKQTNSAFVLPTVLVVMLTISVVVGMVSAFSVRSMRVTGRMLDAQRAFVVAESGLAYGTMRVRNILNNEKIPGIRAKYSSISAPDSPDSDYELRVKVILGDGSSTHGSVDSTSQAVTIYAGARNLESGVSCALRQVLSTEGTTLSDYAAFYDGDFEACPGENGMRFNGKVHSNGDIYITKRVEFDRNLSCSGIFRYQRKNTGLDDSVDTDNYRQSFVRYGDDNALEPDEKDSNALVQIWDGERYIDSSLGNEWSTEATLYYGNAVQTGDDGVTRIDPPISVDDNNHALIEPPLPSTDPAYSADTESQKFANKAALYVHVYADGSYKVFDNVHGGIDITASVPEAQLKVTSQWTQDRGANKNAGIHIYKMYEKDYGTGVYTIPNGGAIQTDNYFMDRRIQWLMKPTDLYLDQILKEGTTTRSILDAADGGASGIDKIIYVDIDEPEETPIVWNQWILYSSGKETAWAPASPGHEYDVLECPGLGWTKVSGTNAFVQSIPCVRVRNGADLKQCDVSVVTSRHLYVEGMFNTTTKSGAGGSWWDETLSFSDLPSAMLAGDTVTTLSSNWEQCYYDPQLTHKTFGSNSQLHFRWDPDQALQEVNQVDIPFNTDHNLWWILNNGRWNSVWRGKATKTVFNAVFMLGIMPSLSPEEAKNEFGTANYHQDNFYSGGLEDIFRWLEDWKGVDMGFNGSILCLYSLSEPEYRWRSAFKGGSGQRKQDTVYHYPPKRNWGYARMTPPGMPHFFGVQESDWARVAWSSVDWGDEEESGD